MPDQVRHDDGGSGGGRVTANVTERLGKEDRTHALSPPVRPERSRGTCPQCRACLTSLDFARDERGFLLWKPHIRAAVGFADKPVLWGGEARRTRKEGAAGAMSVFKPDGGGLGDCRARKSGGGALGVWRLHRGPSARGRKPMQRPGGEESRAGRVRVVRVTFTGPDAGCRTLIRDAAVGATYNQYGSQCQDGSVTDGQKATASSHAIAPAALWEPVPRLSTFDLDSAHQG